MRGIHVRGFSDVSIHAYFVEHSVEVNFPPSFVVATVALTALWGTGAGGIHIAAVRKRPAGGSEEKLTFGDEQSYVWGSDITSVTFERDVLAEKQKGVRIVTVAEVQFW